MREAADGDDVHPRGGDVRHSGEVDVAAGLDAGPAAHQLDAGRQLGHREVVQHDGVHPGGQDRLDLLHRVHLHLEVRRMAELRPGAAQHLGELRRVAPGQDGQVVVLGQDGVGEAEAVVGPPPQRTA